MSTVFLHVGQCGNQVGIPFWKRAAKDENVKNGLFILFKIVFTAVPLSNEKQDLSCLKLCLLTIFKLSWWHNIHEFKISVHL